MDEIIVQENTCTRCGVSKPATSEHFSRDRGGFTRNCKACKGKPFTLEQRFWSKVAKGKPDECWLWKAGTTVAGYGEIQRGRRGEGMLYAHRLSYVLAHGIAYQELATEDVVMHTCDRPRCCNPSHLKLGTLQDNNADMFIKGRQARGEQCKPQRGSLNPVAKLTESEVKELRYLRSSGAKLSELARKFSTTEGNISSICLRRSWKHVA